MKASQSYPLVFHHIPKTAGTSVRTALLNLFGEANCELLFDLDLTTTAQVERALEPRLGAPRLVCGHIPTRYVPKDYAGAAVTFLREPIARMLSLYRFTHAQAPAFHREVGLPDDFSFRDFLDCKHPSIAGQIDSGMCFALARDSNQWPVDSDARGHPGIKPPTVATLTSALEALETMDFGICERMADSLSLLSTTWGLPSPLRVFAENRSPDVEIKLAPDELAEVVSRNAMDIALYRIGCERFEERLRSAQHGARNVFTPMKLSTGRLYRVDELPGREGFHVFQKREKFAWLSVDTPARLHFTADEGAVAGLALRIYAGAHRYPVDRAKFLVNGEQPPFAWHADGDWGTAFIGPFKSKQGLNRLEIRPCLRTEGASAYGDANTMSFAIAALEAFPAASAGGHEARAA